MANQTILGKVSLTPRGEYNKNTPLEWLDIVSYDGGSFLVLKKEIVGITPVADDVNYMQIAKKGDGLHFNDLTDEQLALIKGPQGDQGKPLVVLENGNYGNWNAMTQKYDDSGIAAAASVDLNNVKVDFVADEEATNIAKNDTIFKAFARLSAWWTQKISKLKGLAYKDKVDWSTDIENKPSIPAAQVSSDWNASAGVAQILNKPTMVSQFTNDSAFQTLDQVNTLVSNHNISESAHNDIRTEIASVRLVAEGALVGYAFDTVTAMDSWIAIATNKAKLKIGNSLFIRETDVPDYWWDGEQAQELEVDKVDLSGYLLASVADNMYVAKEDGKGLSANDYTTDHKAYIDFLLASQTLTSIVNIPAMAANTEVSISANASLSIATPESLKPGYVMTIRINNTATAARTVTLPSSTIYINDFGTTLSIAASSRAEVSVWCFKTGYYSIRVGEV